MFGMVIAYNERSQFICIIYDTYSIQSTTGYDYNPFTDGNPRFYFPKYWIVTNGADPDEMPPTAAFHLSLHCLNRIRLGISFVSPGFGAQLIGPIQLHVKRQLSSL